MHLHKGFKKVFNTKMKKNSKPREDKASFSAFLYTLVVLIAIVLLGFLGYYFGFLGFIYKVMMPEAFSQFNLILLSIIFGAAAFFSPCAFTVLPAYVSNYISKEETNKEETQDKSYDKSYTALKLGLYAAFGIITVNMIIGLVIAILGSATPFAKDPRQDIPIILGVRTIAGFLIVALGVMTLLHKSINLSFIQSLVSNKSFSKSMFGYGMIYNAAAIGCTGPIMLGLMLYAYTSGSFISALTAFIVFSLTMGILIIILTLLIGKFKDAIIKDMVKFSPIIRKTAGIVMIIVGLSIAFLTLEGNRIFVKIFFPFLK